MPDNSTLSRISITAAIEGWAFVEQTAGIFAGFFLILNNRAQNRFECDVDAEQFVRLQAAMGSEIHQQALALLKRPFLSGWICGIPKNALEG